MANSVRIENLERLAHIGCAGPILQHEWSISVRIVGPRGRYPRMVWREFSLIACQVQPHQAALTPGDSQLNHPPGQFHIFVAVDTYDQATRQAKFTGSLLGALADPIHYTLNWKRSARLRATGCETQLQVTDIIFGASSTASRVTRANDFWER